MSCIGIDLPHLYPFNQWSPDHDGPVFEDTGNPIHIFDKTTGELYFNESKRTIRFKFLAAATGGLVPGLIGLIAGTVYRLLRTLSFDAFFNNDSMPRLERFKIWLADIFRIVISPLGIPCLFLTGLFGLVSPLDGRKLHSRMEIIFHGHPLVVPCMHPQPFSPKFNNGVKRFQDFTLNFLTHPLLSVLVLALRILRFLSGYAFWSSAQAGSSKWKHWMEDGLGILGAPLGMPVAMVGVCISQINPDRGTKLLQFVKESLYGNLAWSDFKLTPHWFGGDAKKQDQW